MREEVSQADAVMLPGHVGNQGRSRMDQSDESFVPFAVSMVEILYSDFALIDWGHCRTSCCGIHRVAVADCCECQHTS